MATNSACERFIPLLSPYIDGEVSPADRINLERHLAACRDCAGRAADLRAESALLRVGLDLAVDDVDFKDFTQRVMARVTPDRPPLLERLRISLSELFLYHRTAMVSSLATAAVALAVGVPLLMREPAIDPDFGYGDRMRVRSVKSNNEDLIPVILETDEGDTIVWTVERVKPDPEDGGVPAAQHSPSDKADELEGESTRDVPTRPAKPAKPVPPKGGEL